MGKVIAIDGPSGAGKSTVAKLLADVLGFRYLDTGALYRAVALGLVERNISVDDDDEKISSALKEINVKFSDGVVYLNERDVSVEIRKTDVGHFSSVFSTRKPVREFLLPVQRDAASRSDLVAEGRDMTTVVFPDAWKKFYVDAKAEIRARRRFLQLRGSGVPLTEENAANDVTERDKRDSSRSIAPLKVAQDAVYVDTSGLDIEEVVKKVIEEVKG